MAGRKQKDISNLVTFILIVILLNYIGSFVFERFDLTAEKRHSLSDATKEMLKELPDVIYIKVYLEGDFEPDIKRLRDATQEKLDEFRAYGGSNIHYEFINPNASEDEKTKNEIAQQLYKKGMRPTDVQDVSDEGMSRKTIWPWAVFTMRGMEIPVPLLKSTVGMAPEAMVNASIENLEYEMASAVQVLSTENPKRIVFIEGHGELNKFEVGDITMALSQYYAIDRVRIDGNLGALTKRVVDSTKSVVKNQYDLAIIAKPDSAFSDKDLFILDQYLMYGGKILWLVDPVFASMDSLKGRDVTMAIQQETKLEDQLFHYGARLNPNLVQDLQCTQIPIVAGMTGNQPQYKFYPWYFYPLLEPTGDHPIVKNLNLVKGEFTSTVDTVGSADIRKKVLLTTSKYTKLSNVPTRISLGILRYKPSPQQFNNSFQPVAILLEGQFESVFKNRIPPKIENSKEIAYRDTSDETKMIVVSDGDIIKNWVQKETGKIMALGYDRYTKQQYGNKDFLLNCINYLCDDNGLMDVRTRSFKIRLLDQALIKKDRTYWQMINVAVPVLLIAFLGLIQFFLRRKKYAS